MNSRSSGSAVIVDDDAGSLAVAAERPDVRPSEWMTVLICTTAELVERHRVGGLGAGIRERGRPGKSRSHPRSRVEPNEGVAMALLRRHAQRRRGRRIGASLEQMLAGISSVQRASGRIQALHPAAEGHRHEALDHHGAKPLAQRLRTGGPPLSRQLKRTYFDRRSHQLPADRHFCRPAPPRRRISPRCASSNSAKPRFCPRPGAASGSSPSMSMLVPSSRTKGASCARQGRPMVAGPVLPHSTSCERASPCSRP